jgi:hypothetical protein
LSRLEKQQQNQRHKFRRKIIMADTKLVAELNKDLSTHYNDAIAHRDSPRQVAILRALVRLTNSAEDNRKMDAEESKVPKPPTPEPTDQQLRDSWRKQQAAKTSLTFDAQRTRTFDEQRAADDRKNADEKNAQIDRERDAENAARERDASPRSWE